MSDRKIVLGIGPVAPDGPKFHQFYERTVGNGHIEKFPLTVETPEEYGDHGLNFRFTDVGDDVSVRLSPGQGFFEADEALADPDQIKILTDIAIGWYNVRYTT